MGLFMSKFKFTTSFAAMFAMLLSQSAFAQDAYIYIGDYQVNTADQSTPYTINIAAQVTGAAFEIDGLRFVMVVADDIDGDTTSPKVSGADFLTGTLFAGGTEAITGSVPDRTVLYNVATASSNNIEISGNVDLGQVTLDLSDAGNYRYGLVLFDTFTVGMSELQNPTAFTLGAVEINPTLYQGSVGIGDHPIVIWSGEANDSLSNFENWLYKSEPLEGDSIQFSGSTNTTVNFDQTTDIDAITGDPDTNDNGIIDYFNITFDSSAQGFTLNGNAIGLLAGGTITNNSATAQNINLETTLQGNATVNAAEGDLIFNDVVTPGTSFNIAGNTLTLTAGVDELNANNELLIDVLGNITGTASGTVIKDGDGDLILAGTNTFGTLTINAGQVDLEDGNAMSDTGMINLNNEATLTLLDNETIGSINTTVDSTLNLGTAFLTISGTDASVLAGTITDTAIAGDHDFGDAGGLAFATNAQVTISNANDHSLGNIIGNNGNAESILGPTSFAPTVSVENNAAFGDGGVVFNKGELNSGTSLTTITIGNEIQIGGDVTFSGLLNLSGPIFMDFYDGTVTMDNPDGENDA